MVSSIFESVLKPLNHICPYLGHDPQVVRRYIKCKKMCRRNGWYSLKIDVLNLLNPKYENPMARDLGENAGQIFNKILKSLILDIFIIFIIF